jgi:hypothetical protein
MAAQAEHANEAPTPTMMVLVADLLKTRSSVLVLRWSGRSRLVSDAECYTFGYDVARLFTIIADVHAQCDIDPDDVFGTCLTCKRLTAPTKSKLNCMRSIITEASLYREQDKPFHMWSRRWNNMDLVDIQDWAGEEIKTITISQIFLDAPYEVRVRKFLPQDGDMIEDAYCHDGVMRKYQIPQYALADLEKTASMFENFIDRSIVRYISHGVQALG